MKTYQDYIKALEEADAEFSEIAKEEEDNDYGDAMQSIERAEADGFAQGLRASKELLDMLIKEREQWEGYAGALEERLDCAETDYEDLKAECFEDDEVVEEGEE